MCKFCEAKKNRDLLGRGSMGWILFVLESHRPASRWRIPVAKVGGGLEVLFHPVGKCSWGALELQAESKDGVECLALAGAEW